jgi:peptidyl-tRNA hydrolase
VYEEGKLARDKFRAVELRLNRTLLENDMVKRAIADLEKKTGVKADLHAPSAEQLAESDQKMREKHLAEDKAADEARAKLEAAEATTLETPADAATATGPVTPAPETSADAPAATATPTA